MGWLFFVLGLIIIFLSIFFISGGENPDMGTIFIGATLGVLVNLLIAVILISYAVSCEREPVDYSEYELIQAGQHNNIDGNFFLGSGYIDGVPVYLYYFKTEDGICQIGNARCSRFKIRESDTETPKIIFYKHFRIAEDFGWFIKSYLGPLLHYNFAYRNKTGEIVVPVGTIDKLNFSKLNL